MLLTDYIHDFVDDDGSLTLGRAAQDIRENIVRAISRLDSGNLLVLANAIRTCAAPFQKRAGL